MEDKLVEILNLLEKDLKDIDSAVKHLSKSQEAAQALVDANMEFATRFREHMEILQAEIKNILESFKSDSDAIIDKWEQLSAGLTNMADRLGKLTTYFESVNFPARLDKIDTSIATLQQGILSNQTLLNDLFRKIDYNTKKIAEYHEQIIKQTQQVKVVTIFILIIVLASIAISVVGLIPK